MAAPDWMFDSTAALLAAVLPLFRRSPGAIADAAVYARYRRVIERLAADTRAATRSGTLGADLTTIVRGYREAAGDLGACVAGLERVVSAVRQFQIVAPARTATETVRQQHELAVCGLIEALAVAEIAHCVARLPLGSYEEARGLRQRLGRLLDIAIERAAERGDIDTALQMRAVLGALTRDLIERGRPLARIVTYETALPMPSVVIAWDLYQDASRADELEAENAAPHPSFMPVRGRARSR